MTAVAESDQRQPVSRQREIEDLHLPFQIVRQLDRLRKRPPRDANDRHRDQNEAKRKQHLIEFGPPVKMTIERPLQHKTKRRDKDAADRERQQERNAQPVHQGHGHVAAQAWRTRRAQD